MFGCCHWAPPSSNSHPDYVQNNPYFLLFVNVDNELDDNGVPLLRSFESEFDTSQNYPPLKERIEWARTGFAYTGRKVPDLIPGVGSYTTWLLAEWLYQFRQELVFINHSDKEINVSIFQGFDHAPTRLEQMSKVGNTWLNSIQLSSSNSYNIDEARRDMQAGYVTTYYDSHEPKRDMRNTQQFTFPDSTMEIPVPGGPFSNVGGIFDVYINNGEKGSIYSDRAERRLISDNS